MDKSPRLSGEEWQIWANKLLALHYGPHEYQQIPDEQKGDAGIEGFTVTSGHAYQMYGTEEPILSKVRRDYQISKINKDIKKFINNEDKLSSIFKSTKIHRWILFVPYFNSKEVYIYASDKENEVRNACLPYVGEDFKILIQSEDAFSVERNKLLMGTNNSIIFDSNSPDENEIDLWVNKNSKLINTLDDKSTRNQGLAPEDRVEFRNHVIRCYLIGQNLLQEIKKYPDIYSNIIKLKSEKERYLAIETLTSDKTNPNLFRDNIENYKDLLRKQITQIDESTVNSIAYEAICDWLIRCPLDFKR